MIQTIDYLLKDISTNGSVYDQFTPESYLAAEQLNKLTEYFEDSDRLRTTKLHGVGIVCGFQFSVFKGNGTNIDTIEVTPGVAITTDGDLLHTDFKALSSYLPFSNKAVYGRLSTNSGKVVELRERRAAESPKEELLPGELPLARLTNFKDYKLVVYLEHYKVAPGLCSATSCNDTGNHVHMDQKFLLVHDDVWKSNLMASDTIFHEHNVWEFYDALPVLAMNRAVLKPNSSNTSLQVYNTFKIEIDKIRNSRKLEQAYLNILDRFDPRVDFVRHGITKSSVSSSFANLFDKLNQNIDIQYRYDAMRELIETYNEIKSLILHLNTDCNPVIDAFPKHVSLGPLNNPNHEPCRHRMYYSSLHKDKKDNLMIFKSLMIRFYQQLKTYSFKTNQPLRITSSRDFESSQGERAIPYYYKYSNVHKDWNQDFVKNRIPKQAHSYHRKGGNSEVYYPNQTSHLDKDFYRIEGHLGMTHDRALAAIVKQRTDYGLAFDVKSVSVHANAKGIDWDEYKCHFADLHSMLNGWQTDFKCLVKGFEQFFGNMPTDGSAFVGSAVAHQLHTATAAADKKEVDKEGDKEAKEKVAARGISMLSENSEPQGLMVNTSDAGMHKKVTIKEVVAEHAKTNEVNCNLAGKALASYEGQNLAQQQYQFAVMLPTQFYIHALMLNYERSWSNFMTDANYLADVQAKIKAFCSDTNNFQQVMKNYIASLRTSSKTNMTHNISAASAQMMIFELMNIYNRMKEVCCYTSKLNWLKSEIKRRKEDILAELTLKNFVNKHSGAEHMAGVSKGGTFVLVYAGEEEKSNPFGSTAQRVVADFSLPYLCKTDCAPSQIVVLPPAEKPDPQQEYKITNKEKEICEAQEFQIKIAPQKDLEKCVVAYKSEFDSKPIQFDPSEPLSFKEIVRWKGSERTQAIQFFINEKVQDYELTIHKEIELDFEVVLKDGEYSFINRSKEKCDGKLFIRTETKDKKDKEQPWDEKLTLQLKVAKLVSIYCKSKFCQSTWSETLEPVSQGKRKIELKFAVERLDSQNNVQIVNQNSMPLTHSGYSMVVNNKARKIGLNSKGQLVMNINTRTVVVIKYDDGNMAGVWQETLSPIKATKKTIELGFDPRQLDASSMFEFTNGNNIPLSDPGYKLKVAGKNQPIQLNNKGQLILNLAKPTLIQITFENAKHVGSWKKTVGVSSQPKKTRAVLTAASKKSLTTMATSLKRKRPRTTALVAIRDKVNNEITDISKAMKSPALVSKKAAQMAKPAAFNVLDKVPVAQRKGSMPYVEAGMLAYFNMLATMDDTSFTKSVASRARAHQLYVKKHAAAFSSGLKKKVSTMQFHSDKAGKYAKSLAALMK